MRKVFSVPSLRTTTNFMAGLDDGLPDERSRKLAHQKARAAGVNISGAKFHPGLCRRGVPFDPQAWYRDEAEVKQKVERLGRCVEGSVNHRSSIRDCDLAAVDRPYRVADEVVKPEVDLEIKEVYGGKVTPQKRKELTEKYVEQHSGLAAPSGPVNLFD